MHPPITIAMATFNGARFLPQQLASFAAQSDQNWRLLASDDGSSDRTLSVLENFAGERPSGQVQITQGPSKGATQNFLHLVQQADPDGWFAFSDQDDVWLKDKLAIASTFLSQQSGPAVYAARTTICDEDLNVLAPAPHFSRPLALRNALIQACMPGNTIVANAQALQILQAAAPAAIAADIISHDWWVYQIMSAAGARLTRDANQVLLYRQHPRNVMGRNDTAKAKAARFSMLFDGSFARWVAQNQAALLPMQAVMTPENRKLLGQFTEAIDQNGIRTAAAFWEMGLYRQYRSGTAAIMAAALMRRLRANPSGTARS